MFPLMHINFFLLVSPSSHMKPHTRAAYYCTSGRQGEGGEWGMGDGGWEVGAIHGREHFS